MASLPMFTHRTERGTKCTSRDTRSVLARECGAGYYSFETKAAYKILIENLRPKKFGKQILAPFSTKARTELKTIKDMLAYAQARLNSSGPHADILQREIYSRGGDPQIILTGAAAAAPFSIPDLSIAGQSGRGTARASKMPAHTYAF